MPPTPESRERWWRSRRIQFVLLAWIVMAALGSWRHHERWIERDASDAWMFIDGALQVAVLPFWVIAKELTGHWGMSSKLPWVIAINTLGFSAIATSYLVLKALATRAAKLRTPNQDAPLDHSRRRFLALAPEAVFAIGSGGLAYTTIIEPSIIHVREAHIPITDLPRTLDGLRLLQITDTHRGPRVSKAFIEEAVERALAQRPDLVVLTGDYIHNAGDQIREAADLFSPLIERYPTIGVLGNHDWYASGSQMRYALAQRGVRMIDNDRVFLTNNRTISDNTGTLCLAGVGDLLCHRVLPNHALDGVDQFVPRILLSHNPDVAEREDIRPHRIDLMLSGHTHGGQVRLPIIGAPGVPSRFGQKYAQGLVQGPHCPVYISAGVGMSVAPFRFGVPPEINVITLERA